MKIETKRLILRSFRNDDWKDLVEGLNDLQVTKTLANVPHPYTKKDAMWWINRQKKLWAAKKRRKVYEFAIELKSEKKLIGGSGFNKINKFTKTAISGSWIARKYWRNGYIKEAKIALIDFAFNKLKLQKLETEAFVENKVSNSMSKKLGYKLEGTRKRSHRSKATGKWHDINEYGLFKIDWKRVRPRLVKEVKRNINGL